MKKRWI